IPLVLVLLSIVNLLKIIFAYADATVIISDQDISVKPNMKALVEEMRQSDWEQMRAIYLEGIDTSQATFETAAPAPEAWAAAHLQFARLVARDNDTVTGWAALSAISKRQAYAGVAEVSVYVARDY